MRWAETYSGGLSLCAVNAILYYTVAGLDEGQIWKKVICGANDVR